MTQYLTLNLEEQVRKNASDIQAIVDGNIVLSELGIRVVGQVELPADLPPAEDYIGAYGDAYLVGPAAPYDYYIFTRPFEGEDTPQWFNIGQFPVPGPQGPAGEVTQGDRGERGAVWYVGQSDPYTFTPATYEQQAFLAQDMYLNVASGNVFQYNGNQWLSKGSILGPAGANGQRGQRGTQWLYGTQQPGQGGVPAGTTLYTGDMYLQSNGQVWRWSGFFWSLITNITGPQGAQGLPSTAVTIISELSSTSQLPEPTASIRNNAYIIDIDGVYHLYVITQVSAEDTTLQWTDMGPHGGTQLFTNGQPVDIWDTDTKLDKITSTGSWRLYGVDSNGNQTTRTFASDSLTEGVLCSRGANGVVSVGTPTEDSHATTKAYVDNAIASVPSGGGGSSTPTEHYFDTTIDVNMLRGLAHGFSYKPGSGPPISKDAVDTTSHPGFFTLNGAYGSAGIATFSTNTTLTVRDIYNSEIVSKYITFDWVMLASANVSTSDQMVVCHTYWEAIGEPIEETQYSLIVPVRVHYFKQ